MVEKELHLNTWEKIIGKFIDGLKKSNASSPKAWIYIMAKLR